MNRVQFAHHSHFLFSSDALNLFYMQTKTISRFYVNILYICTAPIECNRFSRSQLAHSADYFVVSTPLTWNGFANKPQRMQFENTGNDGKLHTQIVREKKNIWFFVLKCEYFHLRWRTDNRNIEKRKKITTTATSHSMNTFPFDLRIGIVCGGVHVHLFGAKLYELMQIANRSKLFFASFFTLAIFYFFFLFLSFILWLVVNIPICSIQPE